MRVKANVQIFEQYRQLIEAFKTKIEVQNEAVDNRTTADAQKKGFIRQGDSFISPSGITTAWGMVQAYQWFDTDTAVDQELQEMGFSQKSGDDLFSFLKEKDTVEIEAYFYTQKLAAQRVFEIIMGTGTKEERKNSRDDSVIGTFGMWAGKAPVLPKNFIRRDCGLDYVHFEMKRRFVNIEINQQSINFVNL